jgi:hypothetical protein
MGSRSERGRRDCSIVSKPRRDSQPEPSISAVRSGNTWAELWLFRQHYFSTCFFLIRASLRHGPRAQGTGFKTGTFRRMIAVGRNAWWSGPANVIPNHKRNAKPGNLPSRHVHNTTTLLFYTPTPHLVPLGATDFAIMVYIRQDKLPKLNEYKYSGVDHSLVSRYVLKPFYNNVVIHCFPIWMA